MPISSCRLAVVGLGRWGQVIARTLANHKVPIARLVAVVSSKGKSHLPDVQCDAFPVYPDIDSLLADKSIDLDGIILTTPTPTQVRYASLCLSAGIAVLAEKPFITSSSVTSSFATSPEDTFMVDFTHLFNPAWQAVRTAALDNFPIDEITASAGQIGPFRTDTSVLWDWGSHDIALLLSLIPGDWQVVQCQIVQHRNMPNTGGHEIGESVTAELIHSSGVKFFGNWSNYLTEKTKRFQVKGQNGQIAQYDDVQPTHKALYINNSGSSENLPFQAAPPVNKVLETFCLHITHKTQPDIGFQTACDVHQILLQLEKAAEQQA